MTGNRQFETAAFRRHGKPITFEIKHWEYPDEDAIEDGADLEGREVTVVIMVDPNLDVVRFGTAFGQLATSMREMSRTDLTNEQKVAVMDVELPKLSQAFRTCLTGKSKVRWDRVSSAVGPMDVAEMIQTIMRELGGMGPTKPAVSSAGSASTTAPSTGGRSKQGSIPKSPRSRGASTAT